MSHLKRRSSFASSASVGLCVKALLLSLATFFATIGSVSAARFSAGFELVSVAGVSLASNDSADCTLNSGDNKTPDTSVCNQGDTVLDFVGVDGYEVVVSIQSQVMGGAFSQPLLRSDVQSSLVISSSELESIDLVYP
jgi:hypothetical protein